MLWGAYQVEDPSQSLVLHYEEMESGGMVEWRNLIYWSPVYISNPSWASGLLRFDPKTARSERLDLPTEQQQLSWLRLAADDRGFAAVSTYAVLLIDPSDKITVSGKLTIDPWGQDGKPEEATFRRISEMVIGDENLYLIDQTRNYKTDEQTRQISILSGSPSIRSVNRKTGEVITLLQSDPELKFPRSLVFAKNQLFFIDERVVKSFDLNSKKIISLDVQTEGYFGDLKMAGDFLWLSDLYSHVIWQIDPKSGKVVGSVGKKFLNGNVDGDFENARMIFPTRLRADQKTLLINEAGATIRKLDIENHKLSTLLTWADPGVVTSMARLPLPANRPSPLLFKNKLYFFTSQFLSPVEVDLETKFLRVFSPLAGDIPSYVKAVSGDFLYSLKDHRLTRTNLLSGDVVNLGGTDLSPIGELLDPWKNQSKLQPLSTNANQFVAFNNQVCMPSCNLDQLTMLTCIEGNDGTRKEHVTDLECLARGYPVRIFSTDKQLYAIESYKKWFEIGPDWKKRPLLWLEKVRDEFPKIDLLTAYQDRIFALSPREESKPFINTIFLKTQKVLSRALKATAGIGNSSKMSSDGRFVYVAGSRIDPESGEILSFLKFIRSNQWAEGFLDKPLPIFEGLLVIHPDLFLDPRSFSLLDFQSTKVLDSRVAEASKKISDSQGNISKIQQALDLTKNQKIIRIKIQKEFSSRQVMIVEIESKIGLRKVVSSELLALDSQGILLGRIGLNTRDRNIDEESFDLSEGERRGRENLAPIILSFSYKKMETPKNLPLMEELSAQLPEVPGQNTVSELYDIRPGIKILEIDRSEEENSYTEDESGESSPAHDRNEPEQ